MYPDVTTTSTNPGEPEMFARHGRLLPVTAILFGLAACSSTPSSAPRSAAPVPAAPISTGRASSTPTSAALPDGAAASSHAVATRSPDRGAGGGNCPSATALGKLVSLPKGWSFIPSSVECWKGWATAEPQGPDSGDGVYLFQYKAGAGWRYHSQGSAYECEDLGIDEAAPFCH